MNREQKAAVIEQIAADIKESDAVLAVDYRGITVGQVAELRGKLRESGASFRVVKNSLTERAADQVGAEDLKALLAGPTALTFVRGDVALAAKAIADQARVTQLLPFKGGIMGGAPVTPEEVGAIARLPARDVLYGQLVGLVASPIGGVVRTLNALISGVAIQLGGVLAKKEAGEIPAGEPPAPASSDAEPAASADSGADAPASSDTTAEDPAPPASDAAESAGPADEKADESAEAAAAVAEEAPAAEAEAEEAPEAEAPAAEAEAPTAEDKQADPEPVAPAENDNQTDASADPVEAKETK